MIPNFLNPKWQDHGPLTQNKTLTDRVAQAVGVGIFGLFLLICAFIVYLVYQNVGW